MLSFNAANGRHRPSIFSKPVACLLLSIAAFQISAHAEPVTPGLVGEDLLVATAAVQTSDPAAAFVDTRPNGGKLSAAAAAAVAFAVAKDDAVLAYMNGKGLFKAAAARKASLEKSDLQAAVTNPFAPNQIGQRTSEVVMSAMGFIGIPYRWGGVSEETGFDCSGFVRALYGKSVGLLLPRRAVEQAQATTPVIKSDIKPGDLVFFNTMKKSFSHVGVYVGGGRFIHAPRTGSTIRLDNMDSSYWAKRFNGARRVDVEEQTVAIH